MCDSMCEKKTLENKTEYIVNDLERAIENEWISIVIQPIVRSSNGMVCEEEAFARWDDPVWGTLDPGVFIPVLEEHGLIERLDLFILEKVLEKTRRQIDEGLPAIGTSLNLSRICLMSPDTVDRIDAMVSSYDIPKHMIALEVSNMYAPADNDRLLEQLERLQQRGYRLILDDFGYGDVTLLLSQKVRFDAVKINMMLTGQMLTNKYARVVIEELIKTAGLIGCEVIAKGIEDQDQVNFLKEIGCSKHQGYFFSRPNPVRMLFEYAEKNKQFLPVENPMEIDYYNAVDKVNLHEFAFVKEIIEKEPVIPMAIMEVDPEELSILRANDGFESFLDEQFPDNKGIRTLKMNGRENSAGAQTITTIKKCISSYETFIVDDVAPTGDDVHILLQKIADNPHTGKTAVLLTVLPVGAVGKQVDTLSYNQLAKVLSQDYVAMYFVDLETNNYVEYHCDGFNRNVTVENRGDDFFYDAHNNVEGRTYEGDTELFNTFCTKENILRNIDEFGFFSITYRANDECGVRYVNFKAVKDSPEGRHIIIGVTSVDSQLRQQEEYRKVSEEKLIYSRIAALSGNFFAVYCVDPQTDSYTVYKTVDGENFIGEKESGWDFFGETASRIKNVIHKDDLKDFEKTVSKQNILDVIAKEGSFSHIYRLVIDGKPTFFTLKAVITEENDEQKLIIGLINIDSQVKKEIEYTEKLEATERVALKDELTGVNNKYSYVRMTERLTAQLADGSIVAFAIVVFDLNDLKYVNDTYGHNAGDDYIRSGCRIICEVFSHSPVFRVGGDEFVAIATGRDYDNLDSLMNEIGSKNKENWMRGEVTVAAGLARGTASTPVDKVFEQADAEMYRNKKRMKEERARRSS